MLGQLRQALSRDIQRYRLSPEDSTLCDEIAAGIPKIVADINYKTFYAEKYEKDREAMNMGKLTSRQLQTSRRHVVSKLKDPDRSISSQWDALQEKYKRFSNKQFAKERLDAPMNEVGRKVEGLREEIMSLGLVRDGDNNSTH